MPDNISSEQSSNVLPFPEVIGDDNADQNVQEQQKSPEQLQAQLDLLKSELERERAAAAEKEQRYLQSLDSIVTKNVARPVVPEPEVPSQATLQLDDLPDPVQSPTEFKQKLVEKVTGYVAQQTASTQQQLLAQMNRAQVLDNLWNRFRSDPSRAELAKREALLQGAAAITFNELRNKGLDPVVVASTNPDSLIGAIVSRMQSELKIGNDDQVPGASRAATVSAGSSIGTVPTTAPKVTSFVEQHKAVRRKMGLV